MFFEASHPSTDGDPTRLTLEDLIAVQPHHIRGRLTAGRRGPEGERPGRGRSTTLDFDGLSPYVPGDDVRAIDWRATVRTGDTVVRRFAAASHRAHMLVVDLRPDLYFGTADRVMAKTACLATAWLAWKAATLYEPVGLSVGAVSMAPRRGRRHVLRMLDALVNAYTDGGAVRDMESDCEASAAMLGRRDEVCLISDLPRDIAPFETLGRSLSRSRILRFVLVEDLFTTQAPMPGRYPVRGPDGRRQVIRIADGPVVQSEYVGRLKDSGWTVDRALDMLPRRGTS